MSKQIPWLRVFVEGVVIVGSILLAFGLQAWWEGTKERGAEQEYLTQLLADLQRAEQQLAEATTQEEFASQSALMVLAATQETEPPANDSIAAWLDGASKYSEGIPTLSSAEGLVSSGGLQSIQSQTVKTGVVNLLDYIRQMEVRAIWFEQRLFDTMMRLSRIVDPFERGSLRFVGMFGDRPDSLTRTTRVQGVVSVDFRPLLGDTAFRATVDEVFLSHENLRWYLQGMLNETRLLKREVEEALEGL